MPKNTRIPHIDVVRRCLSDFDLDGLKNIHDSIIKATMMLVYYLVLQFSISILLHLEHSYIVNLLKL